MYEAPILVNERQKRILDLCSEKALDLEYLASRLGCRREDLMRDVEELRAKSLIKVERKRLEKATLTEEGLKYLSSPLPEEIIGEHLMRGAELTVKEPPPNLTVEEYRIGLMHLARAGAVRVEGGRVRPVSERAVSEVVERARRLRNCLKKLQAGEEVEASLLAVLRRRKMVSTKKVSKIYVSLTPEGKKALAEGKVVGVRLVTTLTPKMLATGEWRKVVFKKYDLTVPPPRLYPGRKHPYLEFLDYLREILISMGFEEMRGPHVEMELWNFDALFQAQDHPAREIHDTFYLKRPVKGAVKDEELLRRIGEVHENGGGTGSKGWGYKWDPERALRLVLRTQTTAVSARTLYSRGDGEYRCFALDRVFRPENLDAKHSMEFYQLEGIIVSERVTLKHLIGFFNELARKLGLGRVKIKPAYFPFTEPSVEGFIKHEKLGWIEVFPGGMFRPEVLKPLGVERCNVAAWGIGVDRIAMTVLGIDDIRLLFSQDLDFLRNWKPPMRW